MRSGLCAVLAITACYSPTVVEGVPCDPNRDSCPTGQSCLARGNDHVCGGPGLDAQGPACLDSELLGRLCLQQQPATLVSFAPTTITTDVEGTGGCSQIVPQPDGRAFCVVAGETIVVPAGVTLRAIGANPLILFATSSIRVAGNIDVSSRLLEDLDGRPALGAGARTALGCAVTGLDGGPGKKGATASSGGGGGAGGSIGAVGGAMGGLGGAGGKGGTNAAAGAGIIAGGTAKAPGASGLLLGGCPGGTGGPGEGDKGRAAGGNGGGAVYLLAGSSIDIPGTIHASGSGGAGGINGTGSSGGGGGGGSGGMIGLEARQITVGGSVLAHGGGGGGGGGNDPANMGSPGGDPAGPAPAVGGVAGAGGGGAGGSGSGLSKSGVAGAPATNEPVCAGGGGGGGAGIIRLFSLSLIVTGAISPSPT